MSCLPGSADLLPIAERIEAHADAARARAARLRFAIAALSWAGLAADAFRLEAAVALGALGSAAGRLDEAADALRRHAASVEGFYAALDELFDGMLSVSIDVLSMFGF